MFKMERTLERLKVSDLRKIAKDLDLKGRSKAKDKQDLIAFFVQSYKERNTTKKAILEEAKKYPSDGRKSPRKIGKGFPDSYRDENPELEEKDKKELRAIYGKVYNRIDEILKDIVKSHEKWFDRVAEEAENAPSTSVRDILFNSARLLRQNMGTCEDYEKRFQSRTKNYTTIVHDTKKDIYYRNEDVYIRAIDPSLFVIDDQILKTKNVDQAIGRFIGRLKRGIKQETKRLVGFNTFADVKEDIKNLILEGEPSDDLKVYVCLTTTGKGYYPVIEIHVLSSPKPDFLPLDVLL